MLRGPPGRFLLKIKKKFTNLSMKFYKEYFSYFEDFFLTMKEFMV